MLRGDRHRHDEGHRAAGRAGRVPLAERNRGYHGDRGRRDRVDPVHYRARCWTGHRRAHLRREVAKPPHGTRAPVAYSGWWCAGSATQLPDGLSGMARTPFHQHDPATATRPHHRKHAIVETTSRPDRRPLAHIRRAVAQRAAGRAVTPNLLRAAAPAATTLSRAGPRCARPVRVAARAQPQADVHLPRTAVADRVENPGDTIIGYSPATHEQDEHHVPHPPASRPTPETRGKLVQASGSLRHTIANRQS